MSYLKLFKNHNEYEEYKNSGIILPNVSHCINEVHMHYYSKIPENCISFADSEVERICVENFSSNGVCLTYEDAESVRDLGTVFQNNTAITSFDELKYFSGIGEIGDGIFSGCTNLRTVSFSENTRYFRDYIFSGCTSLENVKLFAKCNPNPPCCQEQWDKDFGFITPFSYKEIGKSIIVYVPKGCKQCYLSYCSCWGRISDKIVVMEE